MTSYAVRDAETGEELELLIWSQQQSPSANQSAVLRASSSVGSLPKASNGGERPYLLAETQSTRPLGETIGWEQQQQVKVESAERRFRGSLQGVRRELQRRDLSDKARQALQLELLDKTKCQYAQHVQALATEELAREQARQVQLRLEQSALARDRLRRRHEHERVFHRTQVERVRGECELALTSAMARFNLLR